MSILKQLMEMDPFMRPIGGPVCPPNTPIQSTTPQPDCVVPETARKRLMDRLWKASAEDEEQQEEVGPEEPTEDERDQAETSPEDVVAFIKNYPSPTAEDYEYASQELGLPVEELHASVHEIAAALLSSVGKHEDVPDEDFDPDQLQRGIEVEMEHTNNTTIAKLIAKDHLMEFPDYYDRLGKMERQMKSDEPQNGADVKEEEEDGEWSGEWDDDEDPDQPYCSICEEKEVFEHGDICDECFAAME